jgi:hypothetical protein
MSNFKFNEKHLSQLLAVHLMRFPSGGENPLMLYLKISCSKN